MVCNHEDFTNEEVHAATRWGKVDTEGPEAKFFVSNDNNDNEEEKITNKKNEKKYNWC